MSLPLNNGQSMPRLGFGTAFVNDSALFAAAIDAGYRHFDTAWVYGNEEQLGVAIREKIAQGVVKRQDLFITSKLWGTFNRPEQVAGALSQSLDRLQLDYLDLYLLHWPVAFDGDLGEPESVRVRKADNGGLWRELEKCVDDGLARSIGVSNFNVHQLEQLLAGSRIRPVCNQIEEHLYLRAPMQLSEFCAENGIVIVAYAPLGVPSPYDSEASSKRRLLDDPTLGVIARECGKSAAQVALRFLLERKRAVITRTSRVERLGENFSAQHFEIGEERMRRLDELAEENLRYYHLEA